MNKKEMIEMTKEQYIDEIMELLQKCNKESILYFIKGFLEKQVQHP